MNPALPTSVDQLAHSSQARPVGLAGVALFSAQPQRLADWYAGVFGCTFEHRLHHDGREHWITQIGDLQFEIKAQIRSNGDLTPDALASATGTGMTELSFTVHDAEATAQLATTLGGAVHSAPEQYTWGRFGWATDPDGNRVGVFTPPASSSTFVQSHTPPEDGT